ncbi:GNAT family N-acetyltransferase [Haloechinothrix salitolerans]|uniref:GNAT family N-acetyltransferase n=1 Tax=Haloechinothrix salitolerans TaxID=926830 RepID=A0ABW2C493_9PSEU
MREDCSQVRTVDAEDCSQVRTVDAEDCSQVRTVGADISVRSARRDEVEATAEIAVAAYRAEGLLDDDSHYEPVLRDAASRYEQAELLVAVDGDDTILGTVTVAPSGTPMSQIARDGELEFRMLSTSVAARGRGVGELLTRAVIDRARELGCHRVVLCVIDENAKAIRLYHRLGFVRLPERDWQPAPGVQLVAFGLDVGG